MKMQEREGEDTSDQNEMGMTGNENGYFRTKRCKIVRSVKERRSRLGVVLYYMGWTFGMYSYDKK